jgi:hypothetical protein
MLPTVPSAGRSLRLVSRTVVFEALAKVVSECLGARGVSALETLRAQRAAARALAEGLRARSRRVRGLSRAEFLAELARSRAGFAGEKRATERALAEPGGAPAAGTARKIDVLERRVAKMRAALEEFEQRYEELARHAGEDHGLPSIHRELREHTPEHQRAALTRIFELNVRLQRRSAG